ncbi:uncharacterized protein LOC131943841 [Physella acuta]|uniref:uncharacterized protein LOC131943841 n=1 Tax=Physella acuta TaxID=109671 RepID=UPI0027DB307D|nr:uncharacterized protein LOC131943841 [Physella acuta]
MHAELWITMLMKTCVYISWIGLFYIQEIKACQPAEEKNLWKLSKNLNIILKSENQRFKLYLNDQFVSDCYVNHYCLITPKSKWFNSSITHNNNVLTFDLNISNVTRIRPWDNAEGTWLLQMVTLNGRKEEKTTVFSCLLKVYTKISHLDCLIETSEDHLQLRCKTYKIYPTAVGFVSVSINGKPIQNLNFECSHTQLHGSPVYFDADCKIKVKINTAGQYVFNVTLYPNVTNTVKDVVFGKSISHFYDYEILPEPVIELIRLNSQVRYNSRNSNNIKVEEGLYNINCIFNATTSAVKLECLQTQFSINDEMKILNISRSQTSIRCKCEASHVRLLYENYTTIIMINVLYAPTIKSFQVNGKNVKSLTVNTFEALNFACETKGNPTPEVKLYKEDLTTFMLQSSKSKFLDWKMNSDCKDTGLYKCVANYTEHEAISSVQINVLCPFQMTYPEKNNTVYHGKRQGRLIIKIEVYGYPQPLKYLLYINETRVFIMDVNLKTLNQSLYTIEYVVTLSPHGCVILTLTDIQDSDFTEMKLHIDNGIGASLVYMFTIKADSIFESFLKVIIEIGVGSVSLLVFLVFGIWIFKYITSYDLLKKSKDIGMKRDFAVAEEDNIYIDAIDPYELINEYEVVE